MEATADDGSTAKLADETFRVFPLPKPIAKFANKAGGILKKPMQLVILPSKPI